MYAGETVTLSMDAAGVLGHATTVTGRFRTTVTAPTAVAGAPVITARGRRSLAAANATFTVTG